jgi:hypothetical protein
MAPIGGVISHGYNLNRAGTFCSDNASVQEQSIRIAAYCRLLDRMVWTWVRYEKSGGGRSLERTRLWRISLLNREKAGNFHEFQPNYLRIRSERQRMRYCYGDFPKTHNMEIDFDNRESKSKNRELQIL